MFKFTNRRHFILTCVLAAICWQGTAQARNTRLVLPVGPVVSPKTAQQAPAAEGSAAVSGGDMAFVFGSAIPEGMTVLPGEIVIRGEIQPSFKNGYEDDIVCNKALKQALVYLVQRARANGANAVVGIVSYYNHGAIMDSVSDYECHAGTTRAVVDLKARLARVEGFGASAEQSSQPVAVPAAGNATGKSQF
ncbi:hypothetical protein BCF11_1959 [Collimonas sp. PA-H2]|uniref:hypothetical protein n=1 Tax=Collimonas sp. PA-H2 TaxID=1881062 RepID=UPI000BF55B96|nr:hypothetical protein [Collimonas sp. PA-H2]PFH09562.1 hypothetical protein BCF11_1959 [Collimonas sp. PA-H2]